VSELGGTMAVAANAGALPDAADCFSPEILHAAIEERATARIASQARALRLSQRLKVSATIDASGWLKDTAELRYKRGRGGTIQPIMVRVGNEVPDADVLADGGVLARCREYNNAIDQLRQLSLQLAAVMPDSFAPDSGTAFASARTELAQLDAMIAHRQATRMGLGTVRLDVLSGEIAYFQARGAELAPIVQAAERSASTAWEGDTEEVAIDGGGGQ